MCNYNIELPFLSKPLVFLCLIQFPLYAIRKKLRRFYSFACRPPGLERLLTGEFQRNFLLVLLTLSCLAKVDKKWLIVGCVKLRKVTISFVMSVCPSVRMDGISWNLVLEYFSNMSGKFKFRVNLTRKTALWHEDLWIFCINSLFAFIIKNVSQKIKKHILWQNKCFFGKSCRLKDNVEKYFSPL